MDAEEKVARNKRLVEKFPFLEPRNTWTGERFEDYDYSYTELDGMPIGWRKAFGEQMCEEIAEALRKAGQLDTYRIIEVKEKWGYLHWYDAGAPDEVYRIIEKYENISARTCVVCGKPATKLSKGWVLPWCNACAETQEHETFFDISRSGDIEP